MSQSTPRIEPAEVPRDAYPLMRLSSEAFLRSIDLVAQMQGDKLIAGLVFIALWHNQMRAPAAQAVGVRELARRLNLPYETVRRHAMTLVRTGQCTATRAGLAVVPAVLQSRRISSLLRRLYLSVERMLLDMTRAGVAGYEPPPKPVGRPVRLTPHQMTVVMASIRQLQATIRMLGERWNGDFLRGLVYTAIWTANVKHFFNTEIVASQGILPDELRRPVSILAISNSLRLPYETVRRHAAALEKDGLCRRVGRQGVIVPATAHRRLTSNTVQVHGMLTELLAELRAAGLKA